MPDHIPHPYIHKRKKYLEKRKELKNPTNFNSWLAVKITNVVGTMWCAYAFALLALISFPQAIHAGTSALIACRPSCSWFCCRSSWSDRRSLLKRPTSSSSKHIWTPKRSFRSATACISCSNKTPH